MRINAENKQHLLHYYCFINWVNTVKDETLLEIFLIFIILHISFLGVFEEGDHAGHQFFWTGTEPCIRILVALLPPASLFEKCRCYILLPHFPVVLIVCQLTGTFSMSSARGESAKTNQHWPISHRTAAVPLGIHLLTCWTDKTAGYVTDLVSAWHGCDSGRLVVSCWSAFTLGRTTWASLGLSHRPIFGFSSLSASSSFGFWLSVPCWSLSHHVTVLHLLDQSHLLPPAAAQLEKPWNPCGSFEPIMGLMYLQNFFGSVSKLISDLKVEIKKQKITVFC